MRPALVSDVCFYRECLPSILPPRRRSLSVFSVCSRKTSPAEPAAKPLSAGSFLHTGPVLHHLLQQEDSCFFIFCQLSNMALAFFIWSS